MGCSLSGIRVGPSTWLGTTSSSPPNGSTGSSTAAWPVRSRTSPTRVPPRPSGTRWPRSETLTPSYWGRLELRKRTTRPGGCGVTRLPGRGVRRCQHPGRRRRPVTQPLRRRSRRPRRRAPAAATGDAVVALCHEDRDQRPVGELFADDERNRPERGTDHHRDCGCGRRPRLRYPVQARSTGRWRCCGRPSPRPGRRPRSPMPAAACRRLTARIPGGSVQLSPRPSWRPPRAGQGLGDRSAELFGYAEQSRTTTWVGTTAGPRWRSEDDTARFEVSAKADRRQLSAWAGRSARPWPKWRWWLAGEAILAPATAAPH